MQAHRFLAVKTTVDSPIRSIHLLMFMEHNRSHISTSRKGAAAETGGTGFSELRSATP
jgi:hypothetical protein